MREEKEEEEKYGEGEMKREIDRNTEEVNSKTRKKRRWQLGTQGYTHAKGDTHKNR